MSLSVHSTMTVVYFFTTKISNTVLVFVYVSKLGVYSSKWKLKYTDSLCKQIEYLFLVYGFYTQTQIRIGLLRWFLGKLW